MISKVRGSRLYGTMVIAMAEGLKVGRTHEIYVDPNARKIVGISYKSSILGTETEIYVDFGDVLKFSNDVVIIADQETGGERPAGVAPFGLKAMRRNKITTQSGTHIAEMADLVFDMTDGKVVEIHLPENLRLDIDIDQVIFGQDLIMVPADYEPTTTLIESETKDFIDRIFGNTVFSDKIRESYAEARSSVRSNVTREKVVHSLKTGSRKAKDTILRTSQAIQQALDQINKRRQAARSGQDASNTEAPAGPADAETEASGSGTEKLSARNEAAPPDQQHIEKS